MLSPLNNCSFVQGSCVPEQELAPSSPSHCLFPQPGSHGAHSFSSPAPRPALPCWLSLVPHISVHFPFLSLSIQIFPSLAPTLVFSLHCLLNRSPKCNGEMQRWAAHFRGLSIPFTLSSMLLGCKDPDCACLAGMTGPRSWPHNSSTVLEKAALSGCHCTPHPLSMWEGKGVPLLSCTLIGGQHQGEDGGINAQDQHHLFPLSIAKAGITFQGQGWLCSCQAGRAWTFALPQVPRGILGQVSCAMLMHCDPYKPGTQLGPCSSTLKVWGRSPGIPALDQYYAQGHEMHQLGGL